MKQLEIYRISVMSVFRFFGGLFLIIGLVFGLFGNAVGLNIITPGLIKLCPFMANVAPGIPAGIFFGVMYGLGAGAVFSILALVYNVFAVVVGGITFMLKDDK